MNATSLALTSSPSLQRYGLFTLPDMDSDPNPGVDLRPIKGYSGHWASRSSSESESQVHAMGTLFVQYNVAIGFGVRIRVGIAVRARQCK